MAAKSKKRLSKTENNLRKLEKLQLNDVLCSICQSILIEPVTLPCNHDFCKSCFDGSIENNSLCCPLCRLRIGSWLRTSTKQKNLVNVELWRILKSKFPQEIAIKIKGEDLTLIEEKPFIRLSEPGEIRSEYELELKRLREERLKLEEKQLYETEIFINKIQKEEEEAHKSQLERLKQDEMLAIQMHQENDKNVGSNKTRKLNLTAASKPRLKPVKIDSFLTKIQAPSNTPQTTIENDDENTVSNNTGEKFSNRSSPEIVPGYGKNIRNLLDKRIKITSSLWNKENGDKKKEESTSSIVKDNNDNDRKHIKTKNVHSLPVSLPYTGILRHKIDITENRNLETGSVDSMRQEMCYFKPIEGKTPTSFSNSKGMPLRVPGVKLDQESSSQEQKTPPSRSQYLEGLCRLRNMSLMHSLPSAFVIALNILKDKKVNITKYGSSTSEPKSSINVMKKSASVKTKHVPMEADCVVNNRQSLRRTRSMGSMSKDENETTPKKAKIKDRKVSSERKPYLRSDTKRLNSKKKHLPLIPETINNNKVNAVKNLSSPLKNCDVKKILEEQIRIEKIIEQEKTDFEFARKVEAEWNGRRQLRRSAVKRQVTINYALRPSKKLKV